MWSYSIFGGSWTWLAGNPEYESPAPKLSGPVRQFNSTYHPGARHQFGMTFFKLEKCVYIFGGLDQNSNAQNDLWMFNVELNQWALAVEPATNPVARYGATLTATSDNKIYLFGGSGCGNSYCSIGSDIWVFNIAQTGTANFWSQPQVKGTTATTKTARRFHSTTYVPGENALYVFGGLTVNPLGSVARVTNDLLRFDCGTEIWSEMPMQATNMPRARSGHGMDLDSKNQCLIVFGGTSDFGKIFEKSIYCVF